MRPDTDTLALLLVAVVALLLRLHHLDASSLFMDEIHQFYYYTGDLAQALQGSLRQQQPPLDYLIGFLVYQVNPGDFALRLPAALFGTGTAVLIALLSSRGIRAMGGDDTLRLPVMVAAGLIAALLPYPIYISQDLRPYSSAIFFVLLLVLALDSLLRAAPPKRRHYVGLSLATLGLLFSRTLSPLVVCLVLGLTLFLPWVLGRSREPAMAAVRFRAQVAMVSALVLYLPVLYLIIANGQRYLDVGNAPANWPLQAVGDAWTAQLEPYGLELLWLPLMGVWAAWRSRKPWDRLPGLVVVLLAGATLIHFVVFHTMTSYSYRPPYLIYLFPAVLILSALGAFRLAELMRQRFSLRAAQWMVGLVTAGLLLHAGVATLDFKSRAIKTDWRSLVSYINRHQPDDFLWISHAPSLSADAIWDPGLYGFLRYPSGGIIGGEVSDLVTQPEIVEALEGSQRKPVLVLFIYRDYLLTSRSRVPLIPRPFGVDGVQGLQASPALERVDLTGLILLSLKDSSGNSREDLSRLLYEVLVANPDAPYLTTVQAAFAALQNTEEKST